MSKKFEPIIKHNSKSTLNNKQVEIKGSHDFTRTTNAQSSQATNKKQKIEQPENAIISQIIPKKEDSFNRDPMNKATLTQKFSPSVNLKINTLKPFIAELESLNKTSVNEVVNLLVDSYVNTRLSTRQQEAFNSMYKTQFDLKNSIK